MEKQEIKAEIQVLKRNLLRAQSDEERDEINDEISLLEEELKSLD